MKWEIARHLPEPFDAARAEIVKAAQAFGQSDDITVAVIQRATEIAATA
jgi:hypothetical protein